MWTKRRWDATTCPHWEFVFSKGHSVSKLSRPKALVSAVPNWHLRFLLLMWVIQRVYLLCHRIPPKPCQLQAALSVFSNKMSSSGPNFSRQVPSISGWRLARSQGANQHRLLKRVKGFIFLVYVFFLTSSLSVFPPVFHLLQHKHAGDI